jgi:uncharacterized protein (TIGR00299 family) protein
MKAIYFDCFSGISGDMILGCLLDLGVPLESLSEELAKLKVKNYTLDARKLVKRNISATKLNVEVGQEKAHRTYPVIEGIIRESGLNSRIQDQATRIFFRLAEAEARVHGTSLDEIHFHEVGAVDAIVDVVGTCIGIEWLGVDRIFSSPLNLGKGLVKGSHGVMPVPAPATAELLKGIPVYSNEADGELVTPTGAAILSTLCHGFGHMPRIVVQAVGYGAGTRDYPDRPNVLRGFLGELVTGSAGREQRGTQETVLLIEANIDDMNPQIYGHLQEKILGLGALDFSICPVQMKKNRPGILLSIVSPRELLDTVCRVLFEETTTLGIRYYEAGRRVLEREVEQFETKWGTVSVKVSRLDGKIMNFAPEYEDCRKLASQHHVPYKWIQSGIIQEFMNRHSADFI